MRDTLIIRRGGQLSPVCAVITPMSRPLRCAIGQENEVALVFMSTPERLGKMIEITIGTCYGLTPAEKWLTTLIVEGARLGEAADRLGISINTVRSHMKRIYIKTKTDRQADLVRADRGSRGLSQARGRASELVCQMQC